MNAEQHFIEELRTTMTIRDDRVHMHPVGHELHVTYQNDSGDIIQDNHHHDGKRQFRIEHIAPDALRFVDTFTINDSVVRNPEILIDTQNWEVIQLHQEFEQDDPVTITEALESSDVLRQWAERLNELNQS